LVAVLERYFIDIFVRNNQKMQDQQHTEKFPFIPIIPTADYSYTLPADRIAAYPLAERDNSKLLVARMHKGDDNDTTPHIRHTTFRHLAEEIPATALLIANDSRVIAARIYMQKSTGGAVEVLCLQPIVPSPDPALTLQTTKSCRWQCMVGGRNIKAGDVLTSSVETSSSGAFTLKATILTKDSAEALVEFAWQPENVIFADILEVFGHIPLPPYIKREDEAADKERYQTVYAAHNGSVAAPTAGLHFTERVLEDLRAKGVSRAHLTLHVGAGTFRQMSGDGAHEHVMHEERIFVPQEVLAEIAAQFLRHERGETAPIVAVGTTSMRTLESLYWWGVRLLASDGDAHERDTLAIHQWDAFRLRQQFGENLPSASAAMSAIQEWLGRKHLEAVAGETQLMIVPGYPFQICHGLITNFHQPQSTLMLLVAAFLSVKGRSHWRSIYDTALEENYRFLSYGDSSLLWHL
jgi:S-adenosylmethionine:tRNA ribosyltransferase-isomerase